MLGVPTLFSQRPMLFTLKVQLVIEGRTPLHFTPGEPWLMLQWESEPLEPELNIIPPQFDEPVQSNVALVALSVPLTVRELPDPKDNDTPGATVNVAPDFT